MSRLSRIRDSPHKTSQSDSRTQWLLVMLATLTSVFLYALDNTVVADIVPAIANDFGRVTELPWLSVGFALGGVALEMPFGKLFGLCDAKWPYVICVVRDQMMEPRIMSETPS
jgi:MFS family permease